MKKIISIILSLLLLLTLSACGSNGSSDTASSQSGAESVLDNGTAEEIELSKNLNSLNFSNTFSPIYGGDDAFLNYNPDRGYRTELVLLIKSEFIDEEFLGEGKVFSSKSEADERKILLGPGYNVVEIQENGVTKYAVRYVELWRTIFTDKDEEYNKKIINEVFDFYYRIDENGNFKYDPSHLVLSYLYLTEWNNRSLSNGALECVRQYFEVCRDRQIKNMLRFSYNWEYAIPNTNEHNRYLLSTQCIDSIGLGMHTKQLGPIVGEFKDTIHSISNGFLGFVGEWARPYQWPEIDYNTAMKAIVDNLCAPYGIYFSSRMPEYRYDFLKAYPNYEYAHLIGLNCDAFYGEQTRPNWNSADYQYGIFDTNYNINWYNHATDTAYYTPADGEMYTQQALSMYNMRPYGYEAMLQLAHHRYSAFSYWHGYMDTIENPDFKYDNVMKSWQNPNDKQGYYAPVSIDKLKEMGIVYDPAWFTDKTGNERTGLNAYEFIRDHLGYRLRLTDASLDWKTGETVYANVSFNIKNYGFAAAFNIHSELVILDENNNLLSKAEAGDPSKWISVESDLYSNGKYTVTDDVQDKILTHTVNTRIKMPLKAGKYKLALRLYADNDIPVRLANDMEYLDGYHILSNFEITAK